jgi:hypothetical protein
MEKRTFIKLVVFATLSTVLYPINVFAKKNKPGHPSSYGGCGGYGCYGYGYGYGYSYGSYWYGLRKKSHKKSLKEDVYRPDGDPVAQ